jgi:hypothetical protein
MLTKTEKLALLDAIVDGRVIRFQSVAALGKDGTLKALTRSRPAFKCAIEDSRTGRFLTGVEFLEEKDFEKHPIQKRAKAIVKASTDLLVLSDKDAEKNNDDRTPPITIDHNMSLNLANDRDAAIYLFAFLDGGTALSKASVNKVQHSFYIEDKKAEAGVKLKTLSEKATALEHVRAITPDLLDAYVGLLGLFTMPKNYSSSEKELALYELADKTPSQIVNLFSDSTLQWKLILQNFINEGKVRVDNHRKEYLVNGNLIGTTFKEALAYIMDDKNQAVIDEWRKKTKEAS